MPLISGLLGSSGAMRAGNAINNTAIAAEHGVLNATQDAQNAVNNQLKTNVGNVNAAGQTAIGTVNDATTGANTTLQGALGNVGQNYQSQIGNLNPYLSTGQSSAQGLQNYIASGPKFSFNPSDLEHDPGYQFQLAQGQKAIGNSAAAAGLANSGSAAQQLMQYGQGLAGTYYNDAFNRAKQTFDTNQNTTLSNLTAGLGAGLNASGQFNNATAGYNNAILGTGAQQSQNTLGAGYYGGQTTTDLAKYLATQGLSGQEFAGGIGLQGSKTAGDFAMQGAQGRAAGIQGSNNSLGNLFGGISLTPNGGIDFGSLFGLGDAALGGV